MKEIRAAINAAEKDLAIYANELHLEFKLEKYVVSRELDRVIVEFLQDPALTSSDLTLADVVPLLKTHWREKLSK